MTPMGRWIAWLMLGRPLEEPVGPMMHGRPRRERPGLRTVAAVSVFVAGLAGIVAVANGRFGTEDLRVLATSLGFAIFSSTASTGATLRRDGVGLTPWVGL